MTFLLSSGCSTPIQITEYPINQETKISTLHRYCWADSSSKEGVLEKLEPTGGHHTLFDKSVRETINADLNTKGYQLTDCSTAHFIIDYRMGLHEDIVAVDAASKESSINTYGPRWSIGDDKSVSYEGLVEPKENIITVRHGTIHIAAFSSTNKVLWHSSAEKILREQDSDKTRKGHIQESVQKIMAGFPVKN